MLPLAELDVRIFELNCRVDQVNRFGWLFSSTRHDRQPTRFGTLLIILGTRLHRNRPARTVGATGAEGVASLVATCQ
jgi:hypothetical protein